MTNAGTRARKNRCACFEPAPKIIPHANLATLIQINVAPAASRARQDADRRGPRATKVMFLLAHFTRWGRAWLSAADADDRFS
jgi:hypothetical protein